MTPRQIIIMLLHDNMVCPRVQRLAEVLASELTDACVRVAIDGALVLLWLPISIVVFCCCGLVGKCYFLGRGEFDKEADASVDLGKVQVFLNLHWPCFNFHVILHTHKTRF
eukprot:SAG31_NODE_535_length_14348_cov_11.339603_4_plen_111_part_00